MVKFYLQNYKKFIFLLSLLGSLFFAFVFFYNQDREIRAQREEEFALDCGDEIPIGEAIDETLAMLQIILNNADAMLSKAGQQVTAANQIYNLPLPDACQSSNCGTDCNLISTEVCGAPGEPCPPGEICRLDCPFGVPGPLCRNCWEVTTCQIEPCTGSACPPDLLAELSDRVNLISTLYPEILAHRNEIHNAMGRRPGIIEKLERARRELEQCATPAAGFVPEEELQLIEGLVSCKEANFLKILPAGTNKCDLNRVDYNPDNFLCCWPRIP